jgi:hypothetical protein
MKNPNPLFRMNYPGLKDLQREEQNKKEKDLFST